MSARLGLVMLIDDDEADNYYHRMVIERSGCADEIRCFQRAERALDFLDAAGERRPDLILLDINMPAMNGWDFLDAYRDLAEFREDVVVVMLTTSLNPDDRARARTIDAVADFKIKPLDDAALTEILAAHFS